MKLSDIEQEINILTTQLNTNQSDNRLNMRVNNMKNYIQKNTKREKPAQLRRKRNITNQELAESDFPIDSNDEILSELLFIPMNDIDALEHELNKINNKLENLARETSKLDIDGLSSSLTKLSNQISAAHDDFYTMVFSVDGLPVFRDYTRLVNNKPISSITNEIEKLNESLDRIIEAAEYTRRILLGINIPNEEKIEEELYEEELERAKQEMEEVAPYHAVYTIERHFSKGEKINPRILSERVDRWSISTARRTLNDALKVADGKHGMIELKNIEGEEYRIL